LSGLLLTETLKKPTVRAESILDGIFAQAVVIVEADGDRLVYQSAWEKLKLEYQLDIHFAAVNGIGGIVDTYKLYKTLKIPVAIIADLDIVAEDCFKGVLTSLTGEACSENLIPVTLLEQLVNLPPYIAENDLRSRLEAILCEDIDWLNDDDKKIYRTLGEIRNDLNRKRKVKAGVGALPAEFQQPLKKILDDIKSQGLFIVPVGELENWLGGYEIGGSKSKKALWANRAAAMIREVSAEEGDVWGFMKEIADYLYGKHRDYNSI
jgi:hypothetical protein